MKYRAEIDGIRALAVIPVVLFHAGIPGAAGGFVGVDVFFVISGFLITRILLEELEAGRFSFLQFYGRRVRRLLPAFLLVLTVTSLLGAWISTPLDWIDYAKHQLASLLFAGNIHSWLSSGYFEQAATSTPLLHVWSLAVEEQFYLLFPCLLWAGWFFMRRWLAPGVALLALASFGLAVWGATAHPTAAYFLMPFRAWELLLGACAVWADRHWRVGEQTLQARPPAWMTWMPMLGLGLIAVPMLTLDRGSVYPGWNTLAPVAGTMLLLLFCSKNHPIGKWLASRVMVTIGLLSYSWYLWHQPLLALYRQWSLGDPPIYGLLLVIVASLMLAGLTYVAVEKPVRAWGVRPLARRWIHAAIGAGFVLAAVISVVIYLKQGFPARYPELGQIEADRGYQRSSEPCVSWPHGGIGQAPNCWRDDAHPGNDLDILLVGDSHADALLPGFIDMSRRHGFSFGYVGQGACPGLLDVDVAAGYWPAEYCKLFARYQLEMAEQLRPRWIVMVGRWGMYLDNQRSAQSSKQFYLVDRDNFARDRESSRRAFSDGLARTVRAYRQLGAEVALLEQVPLQKVDPAKFYLRLSAYGLYGSEAALAEVDEAASTLHDADELQRTLRGVLERLKPEDSPLVVRPQSFMCSQGPCRFADAGGALYFDRDHLSARGAVQLSEPLFQSLVAAGVQVDGHGATRVPSTPKAGHAPK